MTVPIETDYLLDVIPQEMDPGYFHLTALEALAIAARSYVYFHVGQGHYIDNSTDKQVFVPYKFESLPDSVFPDNPGDPCTSGNLNAQQNAACNASANRRYVSRYGDSPANAMHFADALDRTVTFPGSLYIVGVEDPISSAGGACAASNDGPGYGLSQRGAGRWARGNRCSTTDMVPGDPWSVRWSRAEQILFHYYTGVHLREANGSLSPLSLPRRWNPLSLTWSPSGAGVGPPIMYHGQPVQLTAFIQNTSTQDWPAYTRALSYRWHRDPQTGQPVDGNRVTIPVALNRGASTTVVLDVNDVPNWPQGGYTLKLDVVELSSNTWFSDQGWPSYGVPVCLNGLCRAFLPLVLKDYPPCIKPIQNGGFEDWWDYWVPNGATHSPLAHSGSYSAWLGGPNNRHDTLYQTVTIPSTGPTGQPVVSVRLNYYWHMTTEETSTTHDHDFFYARIRNTGGGTLRVLEELTNRSSEGVWVLASFDVSEFKGQTVQVYFEATTDYSLPTSFYVDDVVLYACEGG